MNKYWKAENENEARVIIGLLSAKDRINDRIEYNDGFPYIIGASEVSILAWGVAYQGDTCNRFTSSRTESTIEELVELALNGFKEPVFRPQEGDDYYYPCLHNFKRYVHTTWSGSIYELALQDSGVIFRTQKESVECAKFMLNAWNDRKEKKDG